MDVGSAILHFPPCRPGQAQTGDHAASKEDTDGKVESHESLKRQVRGGRVAEFGACAAQGPSLCRCGQCNPTLLPVLSRLGTGWGPDGIDGGHGPEAARWRGTKA